MTVDRTIRLHRVLTAAPEKVYRAFIDANAKAKWLPPHGFYCTVQAWEPKAGGTYRMSFTNFTSGNSHSWTGRFLELVPGERIRHVDRFDDPGMAGEMTVTVTLKKATVGTEISIEQTNVPAQIPLDACHLGWQESLEQLAKLVQPEIPG